MAMPQRKPEFEHRYRPVHRDTRSRSHRAASALGPWLVLGALAMALYGVQGDGFAMRLPRIGEPSATRDFGLCSAFVRSDCVIDGDTFRMGGETIRVMDIDAPETHPAHCAFEQQLGDAATARLRALLNAGDFRVRMSGRDRDQYGRQLRMVERDGRSLGAMLVAEGLARPWTGSRQPWC